MNGINVEKLVRVLEQRGMTMAAAESCTGGMISAAVTDIPGSSGVFGYGIVTYSNEAKQKLLGVSGETLRDFGAVSPQTAAEMAAGLKRVSCADVAVSVTGIAGPGGGSDEKPVGLVYMGLAHGDRLDIKKNLFHGSRDEIRRQTVETALNFLAEKVFPGENLS